MLASKEVRFSYQSDQSFSFPDLNCQEGESMLILGRSGKGKTTFLHLIAGLLRPDSGSIEVGGTDISKLSTRKLDQFRGQHIGIVFQKSHFINSLNVKDNLRLAQYLAGVPQNLSRIDELLSQLNLSAKLNQPTFRLSIGEQQRVAIARAVINSPNLILADEPTSALDDENCEQVIQLLEKQAKSVNANLVIVTHDQRLKDRFSHSIEL